MRRWRATQLLSSYITATWQGSASSVAPRPRSAEREVLFATRRADTPSLRNVPLRPNKTEANWQIVQFGLIFRLKNLRYALFYPYSCDLDENRHIKIPNIHTLCLICTALGISLSDFFDFEDTVIKLRGKEAILVKNLPRALTNVTWYLN